MAYASWSVVFGEQPSAAKWNILGTNDSSFNDGTGIASMSMSTTSISNPYKFRAYRSGAYTSVSTTPTVVPYDAENYDTNNNFDSVTNKGRYTVPVTGFYAFNATLQCTSNVMHIMLYKNGSLISDGNIVQGISSSVIGISVYDELQLTVADYIEVYYSINGTQAFAVGQTETYFTGRYVSKT